ncbi:ABC transporter substrate-binding protein [Candidatus Methanoliparum sp. LAM-1]|uniref:ABC transporter substrate-binding protein n=1 Tax=Candidatus Methanoliparum sp. LAM-1 TaxID=2874846 RepID=UPI001E37FF61|nr:ABC transporter substrate-binding protein [Candidatus Methanoliparum sp. LAM-1]BDC36083.1 iron ABC transporter substrate-binding protein [Candidatus Methanoliparum sp. LAM-1]
MRKSKILLIVLVAAVALAFLAIILYQPTENLENIETETIIDMVGREVEIPLEIDRVLGTSPPTTLMIYMLAPDKLAGWSFMPNGEYIPQKYRDLPVVGGWFGTQSGNYENFIVMNPDVIFEGFHTEGDFRDTIYMRQKKFGDIPVVGVAETVDILYLKQPIQFVGKILDVENQSDELISFYDRMITMVSRRVSDIPDNEKRRVYYAEGPDGLMTDPKGSPHSQLIEICGGINIADCPLKMGYGRTEVNMEQVISWNPEIIIAGDQIFYDKIYSDPRWREIDAVKNHKVYLTPLSPFCWFDRPPGANTIIGIPWTAKILYPEKFDDIDIRNLTKEFYSKFYHYELTDEEVSQLLNGV